MEWREHQANHSPEPDESEPANYFLYFAKGELVTVRPERKDNHVVFHGPHLPESKDSYVFFDDPRLPSIARVSELCSIREMPGQDEELVLYLESYRPFVGLVTTRATFFCYTNLALIAHSIHRSTPDEIFAHRYRVDENMGRLSEDKRTVYMWKGVNTCVPFQVSIWVLRHHGPTD